MKMITLVGIVSAALIVLPQIGFADCSSPPKGFGGAWARQYRNWCESCGGDYNPSNQSCRPGPNWGGGRQQTPSYTPQPSFDNEAERQSRLEAERRGQQELDAQRKREEEAAKKKQEAFERNKQEVLKRMKGITENELGLKDVGTSGELKLKDLGDSGKNSLGLKDGGDSKPAPSFDSSVVDLSDKKNPSIMDPDIVKGVNAGVITVQPGVANPGKLRQALLSNFPDAIRKRTDLPNKQAKEIIRSFKTSEPPNPVKNISNLAPGDVILVAPVPMKGRLKDEGWQHFKDVLISNGIQLLDRWGSDNWSSPASHAAIFLGEHNGRRWYLDNTGAHGPVIKEEQGFLKEYGQRRMDVATLVGQPLSRHEGQELWKGAHELRNTTTYGIWANDKMVCSEASRWLLLRAGRRVPETESANKKSFGIDTGLSKKRFINFSPADFYEEQQYFIVHQLGIDRKGKKP